MLHAYFLTLESLASCFPMPPVLNINVHAYYFQMEWRCAEKGDGLRVFVDDVEVPVTVGNDRHTHLAYN